MKVSDILNCKEIDLKSVNKGLGWTGADFIFNEHKIRVAYIADNHLVSHVFLKGSGIACLTKNYECG